MKVALVVIVKSLERRTPEGQWVPLEPARIDSLAVTVGGDGQRRQFDADADTRSAGFLLDGDPNLHVDVVIDLGVQADDEDDPDEGMQVLLRRSFEHRATLQGWRDIGPLPFRLTVEPYRVTFAVWAKSAAHLRVCPALPAPLQDSVQMDDVNGAVDANSGDARTNALTTIDSTERWLVQPGRYSGDCWHVAAAMILNPSLLLLVPRAPVTPSLLHISLLRYFVDDCLGLEIEVRSQLGISRIFTCDQLVGGVKFVCAGNVEFRVSMWRQISSTVVVCHQGETAIPGDDAHRPEPAGIPLSLRPMHALSRVDFDNGIDRHLADHERAATIDLEITIRALEFNVSGLHTEALEWDQSFAIENLASQLRKHAKGKPSAIEGPIRAFVGSLDMPTWMNTVAWPTWGRPQIRKLQDFKPLLIQTLVAEMSDERWLGGRRLRQLGPARVCERLQERLRDFLLAPQPITTELALIDAFSEANRDPIVDAAKALAELYEETLEAADMIKSEYVLISNQFLYFYSDCGFTDRVLAWALESTVPQQGQQIFSASRLHLLSERGNVICGMTFSATSVLMRAVELRGIDAVRQTLKESFLYRLTEQETSTIEERARSIGSRRCLLLNMRIGGYHPEHDVTPALYAQIKAAADVLGLHLVRIGGPHDWVTDGSGHLNVYTASPANFARQVDLRHTAYLWHVVSEMPNVVGIIGGMSGSLDIAAYMGVRAACWDVALADHAAAGRATTSAELPDRIRLRLSFPFMTIITRAIVGRVKEQKRTVKPRARKATSSTAQDEPPEVKEKSTWVIDDPADQHVIDDAALMLWLGGVDTMPLPEAAFVPGFVQLAATEFGPAFAAVLMDDPQVIRALLQPGRQQ